MHWDYFKRGVRAGNENEEAGVDRSGGVGHERQRPKQPRMGVRDRSSLLDAVRAGSIPVSLGTSAWTRSPSWFIAAALYNVVAGPVHDFLATVLAAAADRLARRIRRGPRRGPPS